VFAAYHAPSALSTDNRFCFAPPIDDSQSWWDRTFFSKVLNIVTDISIKGRNIMSKRKMYNTTIDADLIREIKILAARLEKRQNDLLEEAIKDLLEKYQYPDNENTATDSSTGNPPMKE
jgi:hypothetical protein